MSAESTRYIDHVELILKQYNYFYFWIIIKVNIPKPAACMRTMNVEVTFSFSFLNAASYTRGFLNSCRPILS